MTISLLIKINILRKNYYYYVTAILRMKVEKYVEGCCGEKVFYGFRFLSRNFNVDIKMDKKWMERFLRRAKYKPNGANFSYIGRIWTYVKKVDSTVSLN